MMNAARIMVLRSDRFGDLIVSTGYLKALREALPAARIDLWLAAENLACEAVLAEGINCRALPFDRHLTCSNEPVEQWLQAAAAENYDSLVVPQFTLGFPEILALSQLPVPIRWGFVNWEYGVDAGWLKLRLDRPFRDPAEWITHGPEVEPYSREVEKYERLARAQGLSAGSVDPVLRGVAAPAPEARQGLLIWPGSGAPNRRWPAREFAALAMELGFREATVGATPSESGEAAAQAQALAEIGITPNFVEVDPAQVSSTACWLAGFQRVLANDTGAAHLAAAAGAAVVSLAGSHVEGRFTLTGVNTLTVFTDAPCGGCKFDCIFQAEHDVFPCLTGIDAASVARLVREGLSGRQVLPAKWLPAGHRELFRQIHKGRVAREHEWNERLRGATRDIHHYLDLLRAAEQQRDGWKALHEETRKNREHLTQAAESLREQIRILQAQDAPPSGPRISVITPSYQQAVFIEETILSVLAQDYGNFEHIIVDGGSSDGTIDILKRYPHLKWVSEPDLGQTHAINKGILMSTGDIIAYLNADDVYRPGAFQQVAGFFKQHPEARIVTGDCDYIDEHSHITGRLRAKYERFEDLVRYWGWDRWYCIPQQSTFWRRDVLAETGLLDTRLNMVMDYDMWLRAAERMPIHTLPVTLAAFRLAGDTKTTSRTHEMYLEELAVSRRRWPLLPWRRRLAVKFQAHRHVAGKLLDSSEHYCLNDLHPGITTSLLRASLGQWWPQAVSPRWWLTVAQVAAPPGRPRRAVRRAHRAYLGLKWRITNRLRTGSTA
jgi:ADP-heptose:LPS heptosyltransferase/GT2 family glycosyltransferase